MSARSKLHFHKFEPSYLNKLAEKLPSVEGLKYPLQANPNLECPCFHTHIFVMLLRSELTKDEGLELIKHLKKCLACSTIYKEVYRMWTYNARITRVEELNYLRIFLSGSYGIESKDRRKANKKQLSKSEEKLKKEISLSIAPLQQQIAQLQAQVQQLLSEKGVNTNNV